MVTSSSMAFASVLWSVLRPSAYEKALLAKGCHNRYNASCYESPRHSSVPLWRRFPTVNDDMHRYDKLILVLALVPAAFGALFQGGYFTWQAYLMMLLASRGRRGGRHHAGLPWRLRAVHGGDGLLPGHDGGILQGAVLCHPLLHRLQRDAPHGSVRPRSQHSPWTRRFVVPHLSPCLCWRKQPADRSFLDVARHAQPDAGHQCQQHPAVPQHLCRLPHPAYLPRAGPRAGRPPLVGARALWSPRRLLRRHADPESVTWRPAGLSHHPHPLPGHAPKRAASQ